MTASAVVFAYGELGVRCLKVLLSRGVGVRLVVTHVDDPNENRWFDSVAEAAADQGLEFITPQSLSDGDVVARVAALAPDFIFSFYYRFMLPAALLAHGRRGALNMHGSLLPRFRGRAPVNWAILRGAKETGATLHYMIERADAGDVVDQLAVPILEDDDALAVFRKVCVAAEIVLARSLPGLIDGSATATRQRLADGEYCGRRRPEDGRIDWSRSAREIHDLVRGLAPPYPGAFSDMLGERWTFTRTRVLPSAASSPTAAGSPTARASLRESAGHCIVTCVDGNSLQLLAAQTANGPIDLVELAARLRRAPVALD